MACSSATRQAVAAHRRAKPTPSPHDGKHEGITRKKLSCCYRRVRCDLRPGDGAESPRAARVGGRTGRRCSGRWNPGPRSCWLPCPQQRRAWHGGDVSAARGRREWILDTLLLAALSLPVAYNQISNAADDAVSLVRNPANSHRHPLIGTTRYCPDPPSVTWVTRGRRQMWTCQSLWAAAACRCFRVASSNATSRTRWTAVGVALIVVTAIWAAWSGGNPYTPVAIAGKAMVWAPSSSASCMQRR